MKYKVVIFDLFETLITEWGHKKYTKNEMCADLGIERAEFDVFWDEKEQDRYVGNLSFEDSILYVSKKCDKYVDNATISNIIDKRIKNDGIFMLCLIIYVSIRERIRLKNKNTRKIYINLRYILLNR